MAVCGSRAPLPSPNRAETCLLVQAGTSKFIIDSGEGSAANLQRWGIDYTDLEAVILSHLHSDHISDMPEIQFQSWLGGRKEHLPVLGPVGTASTIEGFRLAYELDASYRSEHHGSILPIEAYGYDVVEFDGDSALIFENKDTKITAFRVDHSPVDPSYAFKVVYKDRSMVISGDTVALNVMVEYSKGVDVLLHDALAKPLIQTMEVILKIEFELSSETNMLPSLRKSGVTGVPQDSSPCSQPSMNVSEEITSPFSNFINSTL